jgi:hypothetical protein
MHSLMAKNLIDRLPLLSLQVRLLHSQVYMHSLMAKNLTAAITAATGWR